MPWWSSTTPSLPFLRRAVSPEIKWIQPLKTPTLEYVPSDKLQLIIRLPANGFVHLQPPLDTTPRDTPGEYDHILTGELEVIAPIGWEDRVESITVGVKVLSKLDMGPGRLGEVDELFERHLTISNGLDLTLGSQRFTFNLILPCTLPVHTLHEKDNISYRTFATLISTSSRPPKEEVEARNFFTGHIQPSHTSISIRPGDQGEYRVEYGADIRMRVCHMTEREAGFVTLNLGMQGLGEGMGIYDIKIISDIWSIAAPFYFKINLPSLSPLLTVFSVHLSLIQICSIKSPRDPPSTPRISTTQRLPLLAIGERVPPGHIHPGKERGALWRGSEAGGKGASEGWEGEVWGRLDSDKVLRATTVPGINTPIIFKHNICVDIYYSVHGQFADGKPMNPSGPGRLRMFRRTEGITLPACVNVPGILHLPTYEESSTDQGEGYCACQLPQEDVMGRMKKHVAEIGRQEVERQEVARAKDKRVGV